MSSAPHDGSTAPSTAERAQGYTPWDGELTRGGARWWIIARGNLAVAWSNRWVKAILLPSLLPGIVVGGVVYFFLPLSPQLLTNTLQTDTLFAFLVGALVGARLISEDRRQGAFMAHFSRPVRRIDYLAGKIVALLIPLLFVTMAAGMMVIAADASLSADTLAQRLGPGANSLPGARGLLTHIEPWRALGAVVSYGLLVSFGTVGIVLGLSGLTSKARNAGVAWFALVALGTAAQGILQGATRADWPALLSWNDTVGDIAAWVTGLPGGRREFSLFLRAGLLLALSAAGIAFVDWRLRRAEGGER